MRNRVRLSAQTLRRGGLQRTLATLCMVVGFCSTEPGSALAQQDEIIRNPELEDTTNQSDAAAQTEEVIVDPELESATGTLPAGASRDEVVSDPELSETTTPALPPAALPSELRAIVHSRLGRDLSTDGPREEVWESQSLMQLEAKLRTDHRTRFALGMRVRYWANAMAHATPDAGVMRYDLDLLPVSGYVDRTLADGLHLRLGYQNPQLGRFDVLSGTDVLSVFDMRDGPTTLPDAVRVGQLAARLDWDLSASFGVELLWVPFFTPHLIQVVEGDYALLPTVNTQYQDVLNQVLYGNTNPSAATMAAQQQTVNDYRDQLSRGTRARLARSGLDAFAPDPNLKSSQVAMRGVFHGSAGELAWTAATALEKLPAIRRLWLADPTVTPVPSNYVTPPPWYPRFYLLGLDGATDIGPVQIGAEVTVGLGRSFYWQDSAAQQMHLYRGQLLQTGLRAEYLAGDEWILVAEGSFGTALTMPAQATEGFYGLHRGRHQFGVATLARYTPNALGFEMGAALMTGWTYFLVPRVFYELGGGLEAELGAQVLGWLKNTVKGETLGQRYNSIDQAFVGLRWVPRL